jgi:ABC-2 type transport system ATP-binding protein
MPSTTITPVEPRPAGGQGPGVGRVGEPGRPALEVSGVTKAYGRRQVLHDVTFSVAPGEIFGILGSNGAGKTTAVEITQGIRRRDGGRVRLLGLDPVGERDRLRHLVGAQLQSSALPDRLRVDEALRLFARLAGDVVGWQELSDEWNLGHLRRQPFAALSGGERQRLFLALALVNRPRIVFLDELTQGLDVAARRETWAHVERVRDEGATVVLVTHFMDEAERLCDRLAVLHEGRIVATGRPAELVAATAGPTHLRFTWPTPGDLAGLDTFPGVVTVSPGVAVPDGSAAGELRPRSACEVACAANAVVPLIGELARRGIEPDDLAVVRPSLEDAFVALTADSAVPAVTTDPTGGEDR